MKKARKTAANHTPSSLSFRPVAEESHKIGNLMLDYEKLVKENQEKRERLLAAETSRRCLLAEVKFLRRRYKFLMNDRPHNNANPHSGYECKETGPSTTFRSSPQYEQSTPSGARQIPAVDRKGKGYSSGLPLPHQILPAANRKGKGISSCLPLPPQILPSGDRKGKGFSSGLPPQIPAVVRKGKGSSSGLPPRVPVARKKKGTSSAVQPQVSAVGLNGKGQGEQEIVMALPSPAKFDLNQTDALNPSKQQSIQQNSPIYTTQANNLNRGQEISGTSLVLDLNQDAVLGTEDLEYKLASKAPSMELPMKFPHPMETNGASADVALGVCRSLGKPSSRNGKRKISWKDQMAF